MLNFPRHATEHGVSIVIPCYDEAGAIEHTVQEVRAAAAGLDMPWEVIIVNDGSKDGSREIMGRLGASLDRLKVVHNDINLGYGASLKRGISQAAYDRIVITDADGTYPNARIPELVAALEKADMVVGARTGGNVNVPFARRPAKWVLLKYARWLSGADIKDVNSGMRAVWTRHVRSVWAMLPNGFSFTTTITIATHINRLTVVYLPIDYFARVGNSSIRPIRDTTRFFFLVVRTIMFFKPLQVFSGVALVFMIAAMAMGVVGHLYFGGVPKVATTTVFMTGVNFFGLGLIGDLINSHRVR